jgi:pyruvate dehydrogenase E2 component (dihydrolipoamide acetyltransferase)
MAITFGMPSLGHTMEKGKVIEWLKQEGEPVVKGEPLLVVETDKVVTEVEAPTDGVVLKILVAPEEERPIGAALALIGSASETLSEADVRQLVGSQAVASATAPGPSPVAPAPARPAPSSPGERLKISPVARKLAEEHGIDAATVRGTGPGGRITKDDILQAVEAAKATVSAELTRAPGERLKISPVARKLAEEHGIDAATVRGTGPGGRITKDDILQAVEAAKAAPPTPAAPAVSAPTDGRRLRVAQTIPLRGMRGRVAERMYQSWNTIPRVTEVMQVDMGATVAFREAMLGQWEQAYGVRISLNDMITKAVATALRSHPRLNATLVEQEVRVHDTVNVGVAVNLDEGLIVPVIFNADQKDLGQIARESRQLADKARAGRLQLDEISDGTFTITNLGTTGVDLFTPIINPPQVAILGVGTIQRRPVAVGDALAVRPSAYLCLVFDHRAVDGVPAASFLQDVQRLLSRPQEFAV